MRKTSSKVSSSADRFSRDTTISHLSSAVTLGEKYCDFSLFRMSFPIFSFPKNGASVKVALFLSSDAFLFFEGDV